MYQEDLEWLLQSRESCNFYGTYIPLKLRHKIVSRDIGQYPEIDSLGNAGKPFPTIPRDIIPTDEKASYMENETRYLIENRTVVSAITWGPLGYQEDHFDFIYFAAGGEQAWIYYFHDAPYILGYRIQVFNNGCTYYYIYYRRSEEVPLRQALRQNTDEICCVTAINFAEFLQRVQKSKKRIIDSIEQSILPSGVQIPIGQQILSYLFHIHDHSIET